MVRNGFSGPREYDKRNGWIVAAHGNPGYVAAK